MNCGANVPDASAFGRLEFERPRPFGDDNLTVERLEKEELRV